MMINSNSIHSDTGSVVVSNVGCESGDPSSIPMAYRLRAHLPEWALKAN